MIITRKGTFDAGHRVMHQTQQCRFLHGHLYQYELNFRYKNEEEIGYAIDFKEIKRLVGNFIEEHFDHGFICNPHDLVVLEMLDKLESRKWIMSLNGDNFCNPTAENIAKELCMISDCLIFSDNIWIDSVKLHETPNCAVEISIDEIDNMESINFHNKNSEYIADWKLKMGEVIYDERKI